MPVPTVKRSGVAYSCSYALLLLGICLQNAGPDRGVLHDPVCGTWLADEDEKKEK